MILVVSLRNDLHALAVADRIRSQHDVDCAVVEADALVGSDGFAWWDDPAGPATLPARDGRVVVVRDASALWWRRVKMPQLTHDDPYGFDNAFLTSEWQSAVLGTVLTEFQGAWVSAPDATSAGSNKPRQLRAARAAGWAVPATLVSQNATEIAAFAEQAPGRELVVKALTSVRGRTMAAVTVAADELAATDLSAAPAIYQHRIPGEEHLRINVYGDEVIAFRIASEVMDWRRDFAAPISQVTLDPLIESRCRGVIRELGLEMGVIDAKVTGVGDACFLEVNPQGQFLFLEGGTGVDVTGRLAAFLVDRAAGIR